ncbi:MAG: hypothetical protein ACKOA1_03155 [Bacteroidota bacterium]
MSIIRSIAKALIWQVLFLSIVGIAGAASVSLEEVMDSKSVKATAVIDQGNTGTNIKVVFVNVSNKKQVFHVEAGRIFDVLDGNYQDLITVSTTEVSITPGAKGTVRLRGFCKNRTKGSPRAQNKIVLGEMATGNLLKICEHLDGKQFMDNTFQFAVWSATDGVDIKSVYTKGDDVGQIKVLHKFLSKVLEKPLPSYSLFIEYKQVGTNFWESVPNYLYLDADYETTVNGDVRIVFEDSQGKVIRELMRPTYRVYDKYALEVRMYLDGINSGMYKVKVYLGNKVLKEWQATI